MFKRVLVLSDNLELCIKFCDLIKEKNINLELFDISVSSFSNRKRFESGLNRRIKVLNLKLGKDIDIITKNYDLVFSIHCKQLFPPELFNKVKCINVHPGYNPINRGWFPQVFSILYDLRIGATIHEINGKIDNGNIIDRQFVKKESYDTSLTLYKKILAKEIDLLDKNIKSIINNTYSVFKPEEEGNLFLKKDYEKLLHLDLEEKLTMQECIDKLRALTHGDYKNAFFVDKKRNKKVYVSIILKLDE